MSNITILICLIVFICARAAPPTTAARGTVLSLDRQTGRSVQWCTEARRGIREELAIFAFSSGSRNMPRRPVPLYAAGRGTPAA